MAAVIETTGHGRQKLVQRMATRFGVDPELFVRALKATAFRVPARWDPGSRQKVEVEVTNEQMMALLVVAEQYGLNPWTKEIYAFPDKGNGVVPIVGVDGWSRIINSHDHLDGIEFRWADETATMDDFHRQCPAWCEAIIYRKDRAQPTTVREYLDECYRPPFMKSGDPVLGPWQSHTKRFLRHKALIQAARIAFGFTGIYDEDEGARIIEGQFTRDEAPAEAKPSLTSQVRRKSEPAPEPEPGDEGDPPITLTDVLRMCDAAQHPDRLDEAESLVGSLPEKDRDAAQQAVADARARLEEAEGAA